MKQNTTHTLLTITAALLLVGGRASADVITDWNAITLTATKTAGLNSNLGSRIDAIESIAVYDAVNSIRNFGTPYHYFTPPSGSASAEAAAAQAAHDVLVHYFPAQQTTLDLELSASLAAISDSPEKLNGRSVGAAAASDVITLRSSDGSTPNTSYAGPANPSIGQWRPTPTGFGSGINQQWGTVVPFVLPSASQFRPGPPPQVNSTKYLKALNEVKSIGSISNNVRTVDQTHIAQFYKQDAELTVNEAARILSLRNQLTLEENALLFVVTDIAIADARIAVWDAKYTYLFWRPVTALNTSTDGSVTNGYGDWSPLIATPAHPSYPSGHSGTVNAGFEVLQAFFGDKNELTLSTTTVGELPRTVESLSQAESENGLSRIYGGIHYSFDNENGQEIGNRVASYVLLNGPRWLGSGEGHGKGRYRIH